MAKKISCTILFFCFLHITAFAQNFCCGAIFTPQQAAVLNQINTLKAGDTAPGDCLNKTLSIVAHIVLDSLKKPNMTLTGLDSAIAVLNEDFKPICLSFKVCRVNYIENYKFDKFRNKLEGGEMKAIYNVPRMINMYFVQEIIDPANATGISTMPPTADSSDYMVIKKDALKGKKVISHEMGHFFGLYHTYETSFGKERNDGSNCTVAGDLLCDTPPDANPINVNTITCAYNDVLKDPLGDFLTPIIGNIMSSHPDKCKCPFTVMQFNRMTQMYLTFRTYLY